MAHELVMIARFEAASSWMDPGMVPLLLNYGTLVSND